MIGVRTPNFGSISLYMDISRLSRPARRSGSISRVRSLTRLLAVGPLLILVVSGCGSGRQSGASGTVHPTGHRAISAHRRPAGSGGVSPSPKASPPRLTAAERTACRSTARACVDLSERRAWLQRDGKLSYGPVPILPGVGRHATPTGHYPVAYKGRHWVSDEYHTPMPYAIFFAPGGIAFHQGSLTGMSHGCVHLRQRAAAAFYQRLHRRDQVVLWGDPNSG
jgi:hypothetical protein